MAITITLTECIKRFKRLRLFAKAVKNVLSREYIDPRVKERIADNAIKWMQWFAPLGILNLLINPFIIHKTEAVTYFAFGFLLLFVSYMIAKGATKYLALMISVLSLGLSEVMIVIFFWYFLLDLYVQIKLSGLILFLVVILGVIAVYSFYRTVRNFLMEIMSEYRTLKRKCKNGCGNREAS